LDNIGSRSDLGDDASYLFGEIDAKVTNLEMGMKSESFAINGPTTQDHIPFAWSDFKDLKESHKGLPNVFNFDWVTMNPTSIENKKFTYR